MDFKNAQFFGFWQYLSFSQLYEGELERCVSEWKDMQMNLAYSFWCDANENDEAKLSKLLDDCLANGIQLIVVHAHVSWWNYQEKGLEQYEKDVKRVIAKFESHPACFGFMIGDEPNKNNWEDAKILTKLVQNNTSKVAFINFNPPWYGEEFVAMMGFPGEEYPQKIGEFIEETGLKVLCYDYYGSMCTHHRLNKLNSHFKTLTIMYNVAKKYNIPCWNSGLSIGHWDFRVPSRDDIRWQIATSVAHGIKGILWFELYEGRKSLLEHYKNVADGKEVANKNVFRENWEGAPINAFGEKTDTYWQIRDLQREFWIKYGDILPYLELEEVHHYGRPYGGHYYYFDGCDKNIAHFESHYRTDATVSRFRDTRTGETVYMIVNNSQEEKDVFKLTFSEEYAKYSTSRWLNPGGSFMVKLEKTEKEVK